MAKDSKPWRSALFGAQPTDALPIAAFRASDGQQPLFLIHGVDGSLRPFQDLVRHLEPDQAVYGIFAQGFLGERMALMHVEDQAAYYLRAIQRLGCAKPYHFLGYSYGGLVAFEMARQLDAMGQPVGMLGMLDNVRMGNRSGAAGPVAQQNTIWKRTAQHIARSASPQGIGYVKDKLTARSLRMLYTFLDSRGKRIPPFLQRAYDINWYAAVNYTPKDYAGRVTLFQASTSTDNGRSTGDLWGRLSGQGVEVVPVSGGHENMLVEPDVAGLAKAITERLVQIGRPTPS